MKFKRLTNQELQSLETEFIRFLAAQSIPAQDWEKIKKDSPQRVETLIEQFSDVVYEKALHNAKYLEIRTKNECWTFQCLEEKAIMRGVQVKPEAGLDFRMARNAVEVLRQAYENKAILQLYKAEKIYQKERVIEMFDLIEQGALIAYSGEMFNGLVAMSEKKI